MTPNPTTFFHTTTKLCSEVDHLPRNQVQCDHMEWVGLSLTHTMEDLPAATRRVEGTGVHETPL